MEFYLKINKKKGELILDIEEIWIENNGYKISNYGKVTKKNSDEFQKMSLNRCGYVMCNVNFVDGFKARSVHRAVAYAFLRDTYREDLEVNHIDGNKQNNRVDNLEWVTKSENQQHESRVLYQRGGGFCATSKITDEQAIEIHRLRKEEGLSFQELGKMYNVYPETINRIIIGDSFKHLGLEKLRVKDKPVVGISLTDGSILEYPSARFAVKDGFSLSCISTCCKGKTKKHRGYKWMYKKDYEKLNS